MDCAAEESEIRHALAGVAGVQSLNFQLSARTLAIHAPAAVLPQALGAIRRAGFDPQPLASGGSDVHEHAAASKGLWRLGLALVLTVVAELLAFFVPDTMVFKVAGMALAATAIWLAGFSTYRKGLAALRQGR
jgi:Cd2+/Zn2+-exporting ATPase